MATKVVINPGICGLTVEVEAVITEKRGVRLITATQCEAITKMFEALGEDFNSFDLCLQKPGKGPLYEYASENFPVHVSCPAIPGMIKAAEAECGLALKKDAFIVFEKEK